MERRSGCLAPTLNSYFVSPQETVSLPASQSGPPVTLAELQELQAQFAKDRDWDQFHSPRNLLLALVRIAAPPPGQLRFFQSFKPQTEAGLCFWSCHLVTMSDCHAYWDKCLGAASPQNLPKSMFRQSHSPGPCPMNTSMFALEMSFKNGL